MKYAAIALAAVAIIVWAAISFSGDGSFKRMVTISGVYSICKPDGYEVVCFLDADGREGGMFCLPLSQVGGACK
jgi:hypothetical protein